ncbi:uncharacterized protein DS421_15g501620 [Arachis hypogaea]|nr:uncharacterized protein DS421_15g501620 [Arachis hypogaea]
MEIAAKFVNLAMTGQLGIIDARDPLTRDRWHFCRRRGVDQMIPSLLGLYSGTGKEKKAGAC